MAAAPAEQERITAVSRATLSQWWEAYTRSPSATFYHGPLWAEIWRRYTHGGLRPEPRLVRFADGATAVIGASSVPTRLPFLRRELLAPEGTYGGWVSQDDLGPRHAAALAEEVLRGGSVIWRRSPLDPLAYAVPVAGARRELTHIIELGAGPDEVLASWARAARSSARRALRAGARIRHGRTREDWEAYAALYRESLARWGKRASVVYRRSLFEILARLDSPEIRLSLLELDGRPCAGSVDVVHGRHAIGWLGASAPHRCPGAANLLMVHLIEAFAEEGFDHIDMGGSGPNPGVVHWKETIGAEPAPVLVAERRTPLERAARRTRGSFERPGGAAEVAPPAVRS